MKKVVMLLMVLLIGVVVLAESPYQERVEPYYKEIVLARISEHQIVRATEITVADLQFVEIWFSDGQMAAIYNACPITCWQTLADLRYVSVSAKAKAQRTGETPKTRSVCSEKKALALLLFFNLEGDWPWDPEVAK